MFKKETEYALRSLVYVEIQSQQGRRPGIAEISSEIDAPPPFTAKILQRLVRLGFLESMKGKNGGYFFNPEQPPLPLKNIVGAIEGDKIVTGCGFGLSRCDEANPCPLHEAYGPIRESINDLLANETIQNLATQYSERVLNRIGIK